MAKCNSTSGISWGLITTIMLCCLFTFVGTSSSADTSLRLVADSYSVSHSNSAANLFSAAVDESESEATLITSPSASKFEHPRQAAKWFSIDVETLFSAKFAADFYLLTEPIRPTWLLVPANSRYRLSSWKEN